MLIVRIYVNDSHIGTESAVRIKGTTDPRSKNTYRLSDGSFVKHVYGDGAAKLAEKMMKHLYTKYTKGVKYGDRTTVRKTSRKTKILDYKS